MTFLVSASIALLGMQAHAAYAGEFAEGYSEGGVGYGARASLVVRRPGLAGTDHYDLKVGGRLGDGTGNAYVGYRVGSDALVRCIYQVTGSRGNFGFEFGITDVGSQTSQLFYVRSINSTTVEFRGPTGCPTHTYGDRTAYNRVFVRAVTSNSNTGVSNNTATNLGYTQQYNGGFFPWGPPSIGTASSSRVCQSFHSATSYNYSFNGSCPA